MKWCMTKLMHKAALLAFAAALPTALPLAPLHAQRSAPVAMPVAHTVPARAHGKPEAIYGQGPVRASYFHAWFASCPEAAAQLFLSEAV